MRSDGYNTNIRQKVLEFVYENRTRTLTAKDIYSYINKNEEIANRATIYRCLDRLVLQGKLLKYVTDDGKKSSYLYKNQNSECHEHLHLQCTECGKIIHLDCDFMEDIVNHISKNHQFDIKCDSSILFGKCKDCQKK